MRVNKPKVVVLCGSSKFVDIMAVAGWLLEREDKVITMGLHLLPDWYRSPSGALPADHLAEHEGCAAEMDSLHLRKIDLCDEIFVINYGDYIGESTRNEILYAISNGKQCRYYTNDPIGKQIDALLSAMAEKRKLTDADMNEAIRSDPTIHSIFKIHGSAKMVILALLSDKTRLIERVLQLENIAPRKHKLPDGSIAILHCPDALIPEAEEMRHGN